jgi:uncharacterized protein
VLLREHSLSDPTLHAMLAPATRKAERRLMKRIRLVALVLALPVYLLAAFPTPAGYVNDGARVLDAKARAELGALLRDVEQQTTAEIALVTVPSLDGMTVEEYANRLFAAWGIGKKGHDNGVLFLVAPADRKVRIEVGYGLEPVLPDGLAGEIIRTNVLPRFKEGDFARGIRDGLTRIATIVRANHTLTADERREIAEGDRPPALVVFLFFACFVAIGFFAVGLGVRVKAFAPLIFGLAFGGFPIAMAMVPIFNGSPILQVSLAIAMALFGYRKGARSALIARFRPVPTDAAPLNGWVGGWGEFRGGSTSGSGSGSSGGSVERRIRRRLVRWRRRKRQLVIAVL